jgi:hypothetical protein
MTVPVVLLDAVTGTGEGTVWHKFDRFDSSMCVVEISGSFTTIVCGIKCVAYEGGAETVIYVTPLASGTPGADMDAVGLYRFDASGIWAIKGSVSVWTTGTNLTMKVVTRRG